jgi:hypothetical protein
MFRCGAFDDVENGEGAAELERAVTRVVEGRE